LSCCSALIKLLQESVGIETCSPHFLELIMKVIMLCFKSLDGSLMLFVSLKAL